MHLPVVACTCLHWFAAAPVAMVRRQRGDPRRRILARALVRAAAVR